LVSRSPANAPSCTSLRTRRRISIPVNPLRTIGRMKVVSVGYPKPPL
jgi:hypothetical protein